jgi:multiple sugar transport system substrate-binding protein
MKRGKGNIMNRKKKAVLGLMSVVLAASLAACGVKNEGSSVVASDKNAVKLRIMWWGSQDRHDATLKAIEAYKKKNPNVSFEPEYQAFDGYLDKMSTIAAAKNLPDLVQLDPAWISDWSSTNRLLDLTGSAINTKDIDQMLMKTGQYNGKQYAIPTGVNALGLVYNKAAMEKYAITPPKYGWTWDEFYAFAKEARGKLDKDKYVLKDFTIDAGFYDIYQVSKGLGFSKTSDGKFNFDKASWLEYMNKFAEFRKEGIVAPPDVTISDKEYDAKLDLLIQDKILIKLANSSNYPGFDALKKGQLALVNQPKDKQGGGWVKTSVFWAVSPDSKNAEEAKKFIDWFVNDIEAADILGTTRGVPSSKKVVEYLTPKFTPVEKAQIELNTKTAIDGAPFDPGPGMKNGWDKFNKEYANLTQQIMFGKMTPEQAWTEIEKLSKEIKK